jgi:hypothetical protein
MRDLIKNEGLSLRFLRQAHHEANFVSGGLAARINHKGVGCYRIQTYRMK